MNDYETCKADLDRCIIENRKLKRDCIVKTEHEKRVEREKHFERLTSPSREKLISIYDNPGHPDYRRDLRVSAKDPAIHAIDAVYDDLDALYRYSSTFIIIE